MGYSIAYIGNNYKIAEFLLFNDRIDLKFIICECEKVNDDLFTFSLVRNIPIIIVLDKSHLETILCEEQYEIDFFVMSSFGLKIPTQNLKVKRIYNIHYSLLPNYKGRHPTFWATVSGEKKVGISIHSVTEMFDEGDIISQESIPYFLWMNESQLFDELTNLVPRLINNLIEYIANELLTIPNRSGDYYPVVKEEDYTINLSKDSFELIFNKVRAQNKYRGAKIFLGDKTCWLKSIKYTQCNIGDRFYLVDRSEILIKYNDNICIKSNDFIIEG